MLRSLHAVLLPFAMLVPAATWTLDTPVSAADTSASVTMSAPMPSHGDEWAGVVLGANTVDFHSLDLDEGATYDFEVTASGTGNNTLTFKIQQWDTDHWSNIRTKTLQPGQRRAGSFTVSNLAIGFPELIRTRISRKILTRRIDYEVVVARTNLAAKR